MSDRGGQAVRGAFGTAGASVTSWNTVPAHRRHVARRADGRVEQALARAADGKVLNAFRRH